MTFSLQGKVVVFTGTLQFGTRKDIEVEAQKLGANVASTVTVRTDLVVFGDKPGSKLETARKLGIPVMDEKTFTAMFGIDSEARKAKEKAKQEAIVRVDEIKKQIAALWKEAAALADKHRFTFDYEGPGKYGNGDSGVYYPPKPADWVDGYHESGKDPNKNHPEWEEYHPWQEGYEGWVSSSMRC